MAQVGRLGPAFASAAAITACFFDQKGGNTIEITAVRHRREAYR